MDFTVTNARPATLNPIYMTYPNRDFDVVSVVSGLISTPIYTPLSNTPVQIINTDDNTQLSRDDFTQHVLNTLDEQYNQQSEDIVTSVFDSTLQHYIKSSTYLARHVFILQAAARAHLPLPSSRIFYTVKQDIINNARNLLCDPTSLDTFFASLAFISNLNTLGVAITDTNTYNDFKKHVQTQLSNIAPALTPDVTSRFDDFLKVSSLCDLSESLAIRKDYTDDNDCFSFSRLLLEFILQYAKNNTDNFNIMPFDLAELICPRSVVFFNIDRFAHAQVQQITDELDILTKSLQNPLKVISNKKITRLSSAVRAAKKLQTPRKLPNSSETALKHVNATFKSRRPNQTELLAAVRKLIDAAAQTNRSENTYTATNTSYARANRRHPDDFNLPGRVSATRYKPDLHIYLDTSGSISDENYEDMIKACIKLASKLDINMYFNSFSHVLSQTTHLSCHGRTLKQIYCQFQKVPKVTGGTDFVQIWQYITASAKRRRELSIIISDMEFFTPTNIYTKHPKNLYYIPIKTDNWEYLCSEAQDFIKSTRRIAPDIRKHLLM